MKILLGLTLLCWSCQGETANENPIDISENLVISSELCPQGDQKIPKIFHQV